MTQHDFVKVRDRSGTNRWRRANSLTELIYGPVRIKYDGRNSGAGQGTHQYTNAVHLWLLYVSGYLRHFVSGPPPVHRRELGADLCGCSVGRYGDEALGGHTVVCRRRPPKPSKAVPTPHYRSRGVLYTQDARGDQK